MAGSLHPTGGSHVPWEKLSSPPRWTSLSCIKGGAPVSPEQTRSNAAEVWAVDICLHQGAVSVDQRVWFPWNPSSRFKERVRVNGTGVVSQEASTEEAIGDSPVYPPPDHISPSTFSRRYRYAVVQRRGQKVTRAARARLRGEIRF